MGTSKNVCEGVSVIWSGINEQDNYWRTRTLPPPLPGQLWCDPPSSHTPVTVSSSTTSQSPWTGPFDAMSPDDSSFKLIMPDNGVTRIKNDDIPEELENTSGEPPHLVVHSAEGLATLDPKLWVFPLPWRFPTKTHPFRGGPSSLSAFLYHIDSVCKWLLHAVHESLFIYIVSFPES